MMSALQIILADTDGGLVKLVFFAVVIVGGWIFNAIKKWQENQQQPLPAPPPIEPAGQLEKSVEAARQRARVQQPQRPSPLDLAKQQLTQKIRKVAKRKIEAAAPKVVAVAPAPARVEIDSFAKPPVVSKPKSVNAASMHDWLTPAILKRQFVLTEILNPPVALRNDPMRGS